MAAKLERNIFYILLTVQLTNIILILKAYLLQNYFDEITICPNSLHSSCNYITGHIYIFENVPTL